MILFSVQHPHLKGYLKYNGWLSSLSGYGIVERRYDLYISALENYLEQGWSFSLYQNHIQLNSFQVRTTFSGNCEKVTLVWKLNSRLAKYRKEERTLKLNLWQDNSEWACNMWHMVTVGNNRSITIWFYEMRVFSRTIEIIKIQFLYIHSVMYFWLLMIYVNLIHVWYLSHWFL